MASFQSQVLELGLQDQQGQCIHKTTEDPLRYETHLVAQS